MVRDRFLVGILIGIGVLVAAALILFFNRQSQLSYVDESTPEGVTRNYLLALQRNDYERAYNYLDGAQTRPDFARFREPFLTNQGSQVANTAVEVGSASLDTGSDTALVPITMIRNMDSLFGDVYRDRQTVHLVRRDVGWKIQSAPYPFWSYEWEHAPVKGPAIETIVP